jgi:hypothetical protein
VSKPDNSDASAKEIITPAWLKQTKIEIFALKHPDDHPMEKLGAHASGCYLGDAANRRIFAVLFEPLQYHYDMDVVVAANKQRWKFMPSENQVWVDHAYNGHATEAHDLLHELVELELREKLKWDYDTAHSYANAREREYIKELGLDEPWEIKPPLQVPLAAGLPWEHAPTKKRKS